MLVPGRLRAPFSFRWGRLAAFKTIRGALMKSPPAAHQSGTQAHLIPQKEISVHYGPANESLRALVISGSGASASLPAGLFIGKEPVPLRHFKAPPPSPLYMARCHEPPKPRLHGHEDERIKANRREHPLSISPPLLPSVSPFTPPSAPITE